MKNKCVVLGGSGLIGQQFIRLLSDHPMFELSGIYASTRSEGKRLNEIWNLPNFDIPPESVDLEIKSLEKLSKPGDFDVAFSGLPADIALTVESDLRNDGIAVFTNASSHRMDSDVPILIPETNLEQLELVGVQQKKYDTNGFIVSNANCSVTGASMYLHEVMKIVELDISIISTYQAQSGAGYSGLSDPNISNNVYPFIRNEEEKIPEEAKKILGKFSNEVVNPLDHKIIANCARVNVIDGHLEAITSIIKNPELASNDEIISRLKSIRSPLPKSAPSAPDKHLIYLEGEDRPQPKLDSYYGEGNLKIGMSLMVGRVRVDYGAVSSFILVHNTIRGGAGGSVLNAELAKIEGYF